MSNVKVYQHIWRHEYITAIKNLAVKINVYINNPKCQTLGSFAIKNGARVSNWFAEKCKFERKREKKQKKERRKRARSKQSLIGLQKTNIEQIRIVD